MSRRTDEGVQGRMVGWEDGEIARWLGEWISDGWMDRSTTGTQVRLAVAWDRELDFSGEDRPDQRSAGKV